MFRNKEIRMYIFALLLIGLIGVSICFYIDQAAGFISLSTCVLMILASFLYTKWRYNKIKELSQYLKKITDGDYSLDLRDNEEGELSILKSEIYKVTITLSEQAEALKKDKIFLADSISDISHQLKTPLTSMGLMTELISDQGLPREKHDEFVKNIESALNRIHWLVASLLKLAKLDAGAIRFKEEPINVKELIHKAAKPLLIAMELKEQVFHISGDDNASFAGDLNWTIEALSNIIKNCTEHTALGGSIHINFEENTLYTGITIADNGEGIDKEDMSRLFDRFYKGKNASSDSIGIGLAMAKSIVEKQGGRIEVTSEKNRGTRFRIKFYKK